MTETVGTENEGERKMNSKFSFPGLLLSVARSALVRLMRRCLPLLLLLAVASFAFADGGRPGEIFNFGAGARPLAMGSAYTAVARDATAVYYNPAGLGLLPDRHMSLMHANLFEGAVYDFLGYAQNFKKIPGGWGLQILRLSIGDILGRDEFNNETSVFSYSETAFSLGAGVRGLFSPMLSIGTSVKVLNRSLASSSDRLFGLDIGLQYGPLLNGRVSLGMNIQNVAGFKMGDTDDRLPLNARLGASIDVIPGFALVTDFSDSGEFRIGTEYSMGPGALRVGYDRQTLSFGGGMRIMRSYHLDVALLKHSELGMSQRISLGYRFGGAGKASRPELFAKDFLARAQKSMEERFYVSALNHVNRAMGLAPEIAVGPWGERKRRLSAIVEAMRLSELPEREKILTGGGEQPDMAHEAAIAYLAGQELKSMLFAHAALGTDTKEVFFEGFLTNLSKLTGIAVRRDEIIPRTALIREKLKKAAGAFYAQRFDMAVRECEEALLLDGRNALAWTRLGSSYFAMGDKVRARSAYEKALEIKPDDKITYEFMRIQGWR